MEREKMKLKAPSGTISAQTANMLYRIGPDGCIDIEKDSPDLPSLLSMGFEATEQSLPQEAPGGFLTGTDAPSCPLTTDTDH